MIFKNFQAELGFAGRSEDEIKKDYKEIDDKAERAKEQKKREIKNKIEAAKKRRLEEQKRRMVRFQSFVIRFHRILI